MSALLTKRSWLSKRPLEWTGVLLLRGLRDDTSGADCCHFGPDSLCCAVLCRAGGLCCAVLTAAGSGPAGSGGLNPEQLHRPDALHLPAAEAGGA